MEYLLGGCTGLLKEVETTNSSLLRLSPVDDQSLDKEITSLCWSGGFGGYFEDEITVGYKDGSLISYKYLTMTITREYKLDSKCIYLTMLNYHFDKFGPEIYKKNKDSALYPESKRPNVYETNDRLLLAVSESGYIYVFDWSVDNDTSVARVKHLTKDGLRDNKNMESQLKGSDTVLNKGKNINVKGKRKKSTSKSDVTNTSNGSTGKKTDKNCYEEYVGALFVYKYKGPIRDAKVHSVMKNRLILGGTNVAPVLIDLFSETILWAGKFPHDTVLGLQSTLDITSLCFMEELGDDLICVATRDSFVYVYDPKSQRDPVFEFNICDYRGIGLSKRSLSLLHEDFNTGHRRRLSKSINEKYSQTDRTILSLATRPSYTLEFVESDEFNHSQSAPNDIDNSHFTHGSKATGKTGSAHDCRSMFKLNDGLYIKYYNAVKKDFCSLYISDNFGTIYNLQFLTGDRLLWWIYRKIEPIVDLSQLSIFNNRVTTNSADTIGEAPDNMSGLNNSTKATTSTNNSTMGNTTSFITAANGVRGSELGEKTLSRGVKRELNRDDVYKLSSTDKYKIVQHLLEARKRLCSSSNNDKKIHFRRNNHSQFVCRILNCFNFHNGSVVDLKCTGDYLVSASLDRFSNVINLKTGRVVFAIYCNQKQSSILVKNKYLMTSFSDHLEFKRPKHHESPESKPTLYSHGSDHGVIASSDSSKESDGFNAIGEDEDSDVNIDEDETNSESAESEHVFHVGDVSEDSNIDEDHNSESSGPIGSSDVEWDDGLTDTESLEDE